MRFLTEYRPTKFSECCILALLSDFREMWSAKLKICKRNKLFNKEWKSNIRKIIYYKLFLL